VGAKIDDDLTIEEMAEAVELRATKLLINSKGFGPTF
jgi:hypothetical protein